MRTTPPCAMVAAQPVDGLVGEIQGAVEDDPDSAVGHSG